MLQQSDWQRIGEVVAKCKELDLTYKEGAERFGVSVWQLYEYNKERNRERREATEAALGRQAAAPEPGAVDGDASDAEPGESAGAAEADGHGGLPADVVELICSYRREHPYEGFRRIEQELKRRHHLAVSRKQIRRVLKAAGLLETCDSSFDPAVEDSAKGTRRFEAAYPGELYQMDVSYIYLSGLPTLYLVVIVDDHSRFCVGAELCSDQKGDTLIGVLHNACVRHGRPQKLLTDQGSGFYTWSFSQTRFEQYLDSHRIEHLVCDPHSPQTQGKVERLIQTVQKELFGRIRLSGWAEARSALQSYIDSYNHDRAHQALGGLCPAERFYGVGAEVSRLQADLVARRIDTEKGLLVFRIHGRTLTAVCCSNGLAVYLDGVLLQPGGPNGENG